MCGLVGVAGDTTVTWKDLFNHLLVVDSLRGTHSTGAALIERWKSEMHLAKEVGHPFNLLGSSDYQDMMKKSAKVIIGHNRYATLGKHTVDNAHPFQFEHVVGAHNGTLEKAAIKDLHNHWKFDTDSQAIYSHINEHGIEATVPKLQGAWALTWFDKRDNTINFLRNNKRPLYYTYSEDHCTLMWASEQDMLKLVIGRSYKKVKEDEWFVVPEDTHMSWVLPESINGKLPAPTMVKRVGKPPAPVVHYEYPHSGHRHGSAYGYGGGNYHYLIDDIEDYSDYTGTTRHVSTPPVKQDDKGNTVVQFPAKKAKQDPKKFRPPYKDRNGRIINKQKFEELVAGGCVFCGKNDIKWGEFIYPLKAVDGNNVFLCDGCYEDEEIHEICHLLV